MSNLLPVRQPPLVQRQVPSNAGAPVSQAQPARLTGNFQHENAPAQDESSDGSYDDISDVYSQEDGTQVGQNDEEEEEDNDDEEEEQQQQQHDISQSRTTTTIASIF